MSEISSEKLEKKIAKAMAVIKERKGAVVALSAGVDSSLVALLAYKALGDLAIAATGVSESLPPEELGVAVKTANEVGIRHQKVRTEELQDQNYSSNPDNRCFYCKETLYSELRRIADGLGFEAILDGTHVDDLAEDRPGLEAAREAGVVSPLLLAAFSKSDVRKAARMMGLSVWDKPAMPCLSSRIAHRETITRDKLEMIGKAELFIRHTTGVRNLRVRLTDLTARIEVSPDERRVFFDDVVMDQIDRELRRLGFSRVTLDLRGLSKREASFSDGPMILPMAAAAN